MNYNKGDIRINMKNVLMDAHELISYAFDGVIWAGKISIRLLEKIRDEFNKIDIDELIK